MAGPCVNVFKARLLTHTIPVGGDEPVHLADTQCSCTPLEQDGVVTHNAWDLREKLERQGVPTPGRSWVIVQQLELR